MLDIQDATEFPVSNELKPSRVFLAKALPNPTGSGYVAQFAPPGLLPRLVLDETTRELAVFNTADAAETAAMRVLFNVMNSRTSAVKTKDKLAAYDQLTGQEFALLLADNEVGPTWFAFIMATNYPRVMDWLSGAQDIPHVARVLLEIFKRHPEAIDTADEVTRAVASERVRRPSRQEQPE